MYLESGLRKELYYQLMIVEHEDLMSSLGKQESNGVAGIQHSNRRIIWKKRDLLVMTEGAPENSETNKSDLFTYSFT